MNAARRLPVIGLLPLVAALAAPATAQMPAQPGIVVSRTGVDASGKPVQRYPVSPMRPATRAQVRQLVTSLYPTVADGSANVSGLTFVLAANGAYVNSTVRAPSASVPSGPKGPVLLPAKPRSLEYATLAAGEAGPRALRVFVIRLE